MSGTLAVATASLDVVLRCWNANLTISIFRVLILFLTTPARRAGNAELPKCMPNTVFVEMAALQWMMQAWLRRTDAVFRMVDQETCASLGSRFGNIAPIIGKRLR
jgi:hypothetical protein